MVCPMVIHGVSHDMPHEETIAPQWGAQIYRYLKMTHVTPHGKKRYHGAYHGLSDGALGATYHTMGLDVPHGVYHGMTHGDPWNFPTKFPMEERLFHGVCFTLHGMNHDVFHGVKLFTAHPVGPTMVNPMVHPMR